MYHERKSVTQMARDQGRQDGERDPNEKVVIVAHWRGVRGATGKACALWFGDYEDAPQGGARREKWVFLPNSQVEGAGHDRFSLPYWLAKDKELLVYEVKHD